jgi:hypothetical protein
MKTKPPRQLDLIGRNVCRASFAPGGPRRTVAALSDDDPCPIGKSWSGVKLRNVPPSFLEWFMEQPWRFKYGSLVAYIQKRREKDPGGFCVHE